MIIKFLQIVGYYNESLFTLDLANKLYDFNVPDFDSKISSNVSSTLPPMENENTDQKKKNGKQNPKKRIEVHKQDYPQTETNQNLEPYEEKSKQNFDIENNSQGNQVEDNKKYNQDSPTQKDENINIIRTQFKVTNQQILKEVQDLNSQRINKKNPEGDDLYSPTKSLVFGSHRQSLIQNKAPILKNIMGDDRRYIISPKYSDTTQTEEGVGSLNGLHLKSCTSKVTFNTEFTEENEPIKHAQSHLLGSTQNKTYSQSNFIFKTETDEGEEKETQKDNQDGNQQTEEMQESEVKSEQQSTDLTSNEKKDSQGNQKQATNTIKNYFKSKRDPSSKRVQFLKNEFEKILTKSNKLEPNFSFFIYKFSCGALCKTRENQLLSKAQDMVEDEIDIPAILNRLKQVDKMKELFLNREQQILFNFFPKPVVQLRERRGSIKEISRDNLLELSHSQSSLSTKTHSFKGIGMFARAVNRFKTVIQKDDTQFQTMSAYQKLYDCFVICEKDKNEQLTSFFTLYDKFNLFLNGKNSTNKKLIGMLGKEINTIFERSKEIQKRHPTIKLKSQKQDNDSSEDNQNEDNNQGYQKATDQIFLNMFDNEQNQSPDRQQRSEILIQTKSEQNIHCDSPQLVSEFKIHRTESNLMKDSPLIHNTDYKLSSFRKSSINLQMQDFSASQDILNTQTLDSAKPLVDDNLQSMLQSSPLRKQKQRKFSRNRKNLPSPLTILDEEPHKEVQTEKLKMNQQLQRQLMNSFNVGCKEQSEINQEILPPPIKRGNQQEDKDTQSPQVILNNIEEEEDQQSHDSQQIQILQINESADEHSQQQ